MFLLTRSFTVIQPGHLFCWSWSHAGALKHYFEILFVFRWRNCKYKAVIWLVRISYLLTFENQRCFIYRFSARNTFLKVKKKTSNTGKKSFLNLILSACISPSVVFFYFISAAPALPFSPFCSHVMWAEAKWAPVMNVNAGPPFPFSPKLQQILPLPVWGFTLCLSAFTHNPAAGPRTLIDGLSVKPPAAHKHIYRYSTHIWVRPDK